MLTSLSLKAADACLQPLSPQYDPSLHQVDPRKIEEGPCTPHTPDDSPTKRQTASPKASQAHAQLSCRSPRTERHADRGSTNSVGRGGRKSSQRKQKGGSERWQWSVAGVCLLLTGLLLALSGQLRLGRPLSYSFVLRRNCICSDLNVLLICHCVISEELER